MESRKRSHGRAFLRTTTAGLQISLRVLQSMSPSEKVPTVEACEKYLLRRLETHRETQGKNNPLYKIDPRVILEKTRSAKTMAELVANLSEAGVDISTNNLNTLGIDFFRLKFSPLTIEDLVQEIERLNLGFAEFFDKSVYKITISSLSQYLFNNGYPSYNLIKLRSTPIVDILKRVYTYLKTVPYSWTEFKTSLSSTTNSVSADKVLSDLCNGGFDQLSDALRETSKLRFEEICTKELGTFKNPNEAEHEVLTDLFGANFLSKTPVQPVANALTWIQDDSVKPTLKYSPNI